MVKKNNKRRIRPAGESGIASSPTSMISIMGNIKVEIVNRICKRWYSRFQKKYNTDLAFSQSLHKFPDRNEIYAHMHHYYYHYCPQEIKEHRSYFNKERRGFGEDAFHAMWWTIMREYKPHYCLEIGVYRGQVVSLLSLIAKQQKFPCEVFALSPFLPVGHWNYPDLIDYREDVRKNFRYFGLPEPTLWKSYSNDKKGIEYIGRKKWDLIYIDGDHDYDIVLSDYKHCIKSLAKGGILVFDDSSLATSYRSPAFASAGQDGPSRVVRDYAMKEKKLKLLGAVGHNTVFRKLR